MTFGEWEARLVDNFDLMSVDLYLMRRTSQGKELLTHHGKIEQITDSGVVKNDMYFARLEREQLQALSDAFANYGLKNVNDHKNEGLLEATQKHLFDMRAIAYSKLGLMFEADIKERPKP